MKAKVDKTIGLKEMDLSSLDEEHPEDSPDVFVVFGRAPDDTAAAPGVDPEATAASAAAVTAAAAVARDVALEAVLRLPPPEPVWAAKAQRALPPENPDDPFSVGTVEDVEVRLFNEAHHYRLVYVVEGDDTEHDAWAGHDPTGWGAALAMKWIKVDKDADHAPLHKLPKVHPAEIQRQERLAARFEHPEWQGAQGRRREHYQDRDVTGQPTGTWSDGVNTWR
jgi:hypothetical protein